MASALAEWSRLVRFLPCHGLQLSTNPGEDDIRPVALGRRNRRHLGSAGVGASKAIIRWVVETRRRLRMDLRACLLDVLPRPVDTSIQRVAELASTARPTPRG